MQSIAMEHSAAKQNFVEIEQIDHVEIYVANIHQAAYFYSSALGFTPVAFRGPESGLDDRVSVLLQQAGMRLVLTSSTGSHSAISEYIHLHGDSVRGVAFTVDDAEGAFRRAVACGAQAVQLPATVQDGKGRMISSAIEACGGLAHSFIERSNYDGEFLPGFQPIPQAKENQAPRFTSLDHVAICLAKGTLDFWVKFYGEAFGFESHYQIDISTEYSGMKSKALRNKRGNVQCVLLEPAEGKRKSQIQEYLNFHHGPGVQHLAFLTDDLIDTLRALQNRGIEFLSTPRPYYDQLEGRLGKLGDPLDVLRELNILVDCDETGQLMQVFTKPLHTRPTWFLEIIERRGARGFGGGNVKALFEAVEAEQALRAK